MFFQDFQGLLAIIRQDDAVTMPFEEMAQIFRLGGAVLYNQNFYLLLRGLFPCIQRTLLSCAYCSEGAEKYRFKQFLSKNWY
jgi:hypothetical protein